jgi:hypothetical protein
MKEDKAEISDSQEVPSELINKNTDMESKDTQPNDSSESTTYPSEREAQYAKMKAEQESNINEDIVRELAEIGNEDGVEKSQESKDDVTKEAEKKVKEEGEDDDDTNLTDSDRIKAKIEKRIGKEVSKRKTAEEQLAEAQAELARLKAEVEKPKDEKKEDKKDTSDSPTEAQVKEYIIKMREEGNIQEEEAARDYLFNMRVDAKVKEIEEKQNAKVKATTEENTQYNALVGDYTTDEPTDDLNLANTDSKLFKTAMSLYSDKELNSIYSDSNKINGFRRAVGDAYRELITLEREGKITLNAKKQAQTIKTQVKPRDTSAQLASPDAESGVDETIPPSNKPMSDQEKVKAELLNRTKFMNKRMRVSI